MHSAYADKEYPVVSQGGLIFRGRCAWDFSYANISESLLGIWHLYVAARHYPADMNTSTAVEAARKLTILIVDDEPASMRALCDTLEYEGYQTYGYTSAADALAAMRERSFDLL